MPGTVLSDLHVLTHLLLKKKKTYEANLIINHILHIWKLNQRSGYDHMRKLRHRVEYLAQGQVNKWWNLNLGYWLRSHVLTHHFILPLSICCKDKHYFRKYLLWVYIECVSVCTNICVALQCKIYLFLWVTDKSV